MTTRTFIKTILLASLFVSPAFSQRQYTVKKTQSSPTIDGVITGAEWDGVELAGDWELLREPEGTPDAHGWSFGATWDDENLYILYKTNYSDWVLGTGSEFEEPEDCALERNCGGTNFGGAPDSVNMYIDPNVAGLDNEEVANGYQFAFGLNEGQSSYVDGAITNTFVFQEAHVQTNFGNQGEYGLGEHDGHTLWSFVANADENGGVVEMAFPWNAFDAVDELVNHAFAPKDGEVWYFNTGIITSDPDNFLPLWNWNSSQSFVTRPDGELIFSDALGGGTPGDLNSNGVRDAGDIDALSAAIAANSNDGQFDLNGDGSVNAGDRATLITDLMNTFSGDSNLDGEFNSGDFVAVFTAGEYEDGVAGNSTWATGDWNGDGDFDSGDFVVAFAEGGFEIGPMEGGFMATPEPSATILFAIGLLGFLANRRR